jgi:hypothetical protein
MADVDDAAALADLTAVRGVGLWSAQMFLVHQLSARTSCPQVTSASAGRSSAPGSSTPYPGPRRPAAAPSLVPLPHVRRGPVVGLALHAPPLRGEAGRSCAPNTRDHAVNRAARTGAGAAGPRQAERPARSTGPPPPGARFLRVPPLPQSVP